MLRSTLAYMIAQVVIFSLLAFLVFTVASLSATLFFIFLFATLFSEVAVVEYLSLGRSL